MSNLRAVKLIDYVEAESPLATEEDSSVSVLYEYYLVEGTSPEELLTNLDKHGPGDGSGFRYHALTTWVLKENPNKKCVIRVLLPKAKEYDLFDPRLKKNWDLFSKAIENHENQHVKLIKSNFIINKIDMLAQIAAKIRQANSDFDSHNNHDRHLRKLLKK